MGAPAIIDNYVGTKMGNFLTDIVSNLNPVQLNKSNTAQKNPNIFHNAPAIRDLFKTDPKFVLDIDSTGIRKKRTQGMSFSDYFLGKKVGATLPNTSKDLTSFTRFVDQKNDAVRATTRTVAASALAAYGVAPLVLGEDNFVNRTIGAAAQAGVHAGITAAAVRSGGSGSMSAGAMFGVGYGGWATLNAIRSGNNYGPF